MDQWIVEAIVTIVVLIVGALLSRRDADQQRQMDANKQAAEKAVSDLNANVTKQLDEFAKHRDNHYRQHDEDSKALQMLREQIAREHYQKHELDQKFEKLEATTREGLASVVSEIRRLSDAMLRHLSEGGDSNRKEF